MDINELTQHTSAILSSLTHTSIDIDPEVTRQIKDINEISPHDISKIEDYRVKGGDKFKLPENASSMPYIADIHDNGDVGLRTIEPSTYKMSGSSRLSNKMSATRLAKFRNEIHKINKAAFGNGLNLDAFNVLNVSNRPMNKGNIKYLLEKGHVLPLGSSHGVFIPKFGLSPSLFSAEYEGAFTYQVDHTYDQLATFDRYVTDRTKHHFDIDVRSLLSHDVNRMYSYKAYRDPSYAPGGGAHGQEVVFGAAPMSNTLFAMNAAFAAWDRDGAVLPQHRVMDKNAGMHINTTVPSLSIHNQAQLSNYLNSTGLVIDALSRNKVRWASTSYLGVTDAYVGEHNRKDFRLGPSTQRLESRFPGAVMDIGYITNQFVMASKITNDASRYLQNFGDTRVRRTVQGLGSMSGFNNANDRLLKHLHTNRDDDRSRLIKNWFNSFMEHNGITDDFEKQFILNMNKRCITTAS